MNKLTKTERCHEFVRAMNFEGSMAAPPTQSWPHKFYVVELEPGARVIATKGDDDSLSVVSFEHVIHCLLAWNHLHVSADWFITYKDGKEIIKTWVGIADPIYAKDIKPVRWKSEPGYAWRKLPWDPIDSPTPVWDSLTRRMSNEAAFRAFIGSLFFESARQHQYLWIYGSGGAGKSSISNFLSDVFQKAYVSKQPKEKGDKFWAFELIGARVAVFPDCNAQSLTTTGYFKSLCGGDPINLEAKSHMAFTGRINCKFILLSNNEPTISGSSADLRRMIYCTIQKHTGVIDTDFQKKLWNEGAAFLTKCIREYREICPNHEPIPVDIDEIVERVSVNEEPFEQFFDQYFVPHPNSSHAFLAALSPDDFSLWAVSPTLMHNRLKDAFPHHLDREKAREWMERTHGVRKKKIKLNNNRGLIWCYPGIKCRDLVKKENFFPFFLAKGGTVPYEGNLKVLEIKSSSQVPIVPK